MLSLMPFTPRYAIFYAIYPKLCYRLCHIPRSSAIFFLNVMLQYITLTPSYANSSYAMFSGQSRGRISGYCCRNTFLYFFIIFVPPTCTVVWNALKLEGKKLRLKNILLLPSKYNGVVSAEGNAFRKCQQIILPLITINAIIFRGQNLS